MHTYRKYTCTPILIYRYKHKHIYEYANIHIYKYVNIQPYTDANAQLYTYTNLQLYTYTTTKYTGIHIRNTQVDNTTLKLHTYEHR